MRIQGGRVDSALLSRGWTVLPEFKSFSYCVTSFLSRALSTWHCLPGIVYLFFGVTRGCFALIFKINERLHIILSPLLAVSIIIICVAYDPLLNFLLLKTDCDGALTCSVFYFVQ